MRVADRDGVNHGLGIPDVPGRQRQGDGNPQRPQAGHVVPLQVIGTGDLVPHGMEDFGQRTHTRAADADKMNPPDTRQKRRCFH